MSQTFWRATFQMMVTALGLIIGDYLMDGVRFDQNWKALVTAIVLAVLNTFLKPLLVLLTIPATLFTFGLFLLVINAIILLIAGELVPGFYIAGFWSAFWLSLLISAISTLAGANVQIRKYKDPDEEA
ncbi:MAG: phage holin family protein [Flavobacteriales bacterium]